MTKINEPEFESLEDITVYEVVTEYQVTPMGQINNYPHIFLQLCDGEIINASSGEVVIHLSQFENQEAVTIKESPESTSTRSSQRSPKPLLIDSDHVYSTSEDAEHGLDENKRPE